MNKKTVNALYVDALELACNNPDDLKLVDV